MIISGWYKKEIFYNQNNSYHVASIQAADNRDITIIGYFPKLLKNEFYHFDGDFINNNYGKQFSVSSYELEIKKDEASLILFLSSTLFKGIGKKTAKNIVSHLGTNAIDKIIKDKAVLNQVSGLNDIKIETIYNGLIIHYEAEKIIRFLLKHGFGNNLAMRIFKKYKTNTIATIEENPYRLIDDIDGIGFKRADSLALSLGYDVFSPFRIQAAINYLFEQYCFSEGSTYLTYEELIKKSSEFLEPNIAYEAIKANIETLIAKNKIINVKNRYFLPILYNSEKTIAEKILNLLSIETETTLAEDVNTIIATVANKEHITYSAKQIEAIETAMQNKIVIITGGPGTGKTTVVKGIITTYCELNRSQKDILSQIALVAPTGRAAKRLSIATGYEAQTIHRLLGYQLNGEFTYNEHELLQCKLIVIDEASMIDVILLSHLLKAIKKTTKIIFVGDINQLPSVGPGEVLKDLINSQIIKAVYLDKIHRQKADSTIIACAHDINEQILTSDLLEKQEDRNFIICRDELILDNLQFIVSNALEKSFTLDQIQILAPMYKGQIGIDKINNHLQSCLNPNNGDKIELRYYNKLFRVGDKVIQLINRPEKNIMNGDIGYIKEIFTSEDKTKLIVDFDNNEVEYDENNLDDLQLAYCISIHKSQGSEFDIVVLILSKSYSIMLRKKLLYTAVTRAKKALVILGDYEAYKLALSNTRETKRKTTLGEFLQKTPEKAYIKIDNFKFKYQKVKDITPYHFLK